jgi:hypothetical protein
MNIDLHLTFLTSIKKDLPEIAKWLGTLLIAIITALLTAQVAIRKYYQEQRIARLQKLYLEDAFFGQAKAIEENMSHIHANLNPFEILLEYASDGNHRLGSEQNRNP